MDYILKGKTMSNKTLTENKMGVMPIAPLLASMAVPMMISMLVQALYNVVDSVFVAQIGEDALNAVSLAFPLQNLMIAFGAGTAVGMNAVLSRSLGEKNRSAADRAANTGIFVFLCSFVLFALIGGFLSRPYFHALTDIESIVDDGVKYTTICLCFSFGIFMQFCFERLLQSTGRTTLSMITQLIGAVTNIILDPIFIFDKGQVLFDGAFTMPVGLGMGVAGAAIATVAGQILAAILAVIMNIKHNPEVHLSVKLIRPDKAMITEIYRVGLPSIVMQSISSVMTFSMNKIIISFSTAATAVFGAYFKLQSFVLMPVFGLNNGMVPVIAYNYGAKKRKRVWGTVRLAICTAEALMVVGVLLFELFPDMLLGFFNASEEMLTVGRSAFRIIATHFVLAGVCIISLSVVQAIGNPVYALIVSVCRQLVVLVPVAYLLSLTGRLEMVWLAFPIAELVSLILSVIFLSKTVKSANARMAEADTADGNA